MDCLFFCFFFVFFLFVIVALPELFIIWVATWQNQQSDCAPSEDSDQPGHPPSLRTQAFFMRTAKTLIRLGGCPGWSSLGAQPFYCFVMSWLIYLKLVYRLALSPVYSYLSCGTFIDISHISVPAQLSWSNSHLRHHKNVTFCSEYDGCEFDQFLYWDEGRTLFE